MAEDARNDMGTTTAGIFAGVAAGDEVALGDLLAHFQRRLRAHAGAALARFPKVAPHYETDDIVQQVSMRLVGEIRRKRLDSPARFWGLVATCIQRELIDLKRKVTGPQGDARNLYANRPADPEKHDALLAAKPNGESGQMTNLADEEFHETVNGLPEPERSVYRLRYYSGHTHREIGELLGLSLEKTRELWFEAVERVEAALKGFRPGQHLR